LFNLRWYSVNDKILGIYKDKIFYILFKIDDRWAVKSNTALNNEANKFSLRLIELCASNFNATTLPIRDLLKEDLIGAMMI